MTEEYHRAVHRFLVLYVQGRVTVSGNLDEPMVALDAVNAIIKEHDKYALSLQGEE